jgi:hypothetical protein
MDSYVGILTGVAQKVRHEFEEEESRISKMEAEGRRQRFEKYQAKQSKMQSGSKKGK